MDQDRSRSPSKYKMVVSLDGMSKKTHFTAEEVRQLLLLYQDLTTPGKMDRLKVREMMHTTFDITDDIMLDRIFRVVDTNNDGIVDEVEWIQGLSIFLRGTLDEHINFAYLCYDINGDRSLARDELYHCLKNCLIRTTGIEEDVEESVKEIVEIAMRKLDTDKNGQITFPDFQAAVIADPLLLEACGPCLPSQKAVANFFIKLKNEYSRDKNAKKGASNSVNDSGGGPGSGQSNKNISAAGKKDKTPRAGSANILDS